MISDPLTNDVRHRSFGCVVLAAGLLVALVFHASVAGANPPTVAHWSMDDGAGSTVADVTGSGHVGTVDGAQWVSSTPSGIGSALSFDGANDAVHVGEVNVAGEALTIALWFKANSFSVTDARLISKATGSASRKHHWMLSTSGSSGTKLRARLRTSGSTKTLVSGKVLTPGVWTHVALVYDGAFMRIYKDGVEVASAAKTGPLSTDPGVLAAIANQPQGAGSAPFDGIIDDVRIYQRALAASELADLATSANEAPVALPDVYEILQDTVLSPDAASGVLSNDTDPESDPLTAFLFDDVSSGTLVLSGDGSFQYTPDAGFSGSDSFSYEVSDGEWLSNVATVSLTVRDADEPIAVDDTYSSDQEVTLVVDAAYGVLSNDSDPQGDPLIAVLATAPANGSLLLNTDGSFDYTPDAGFFGTDSFSYQADDGDAISNVATALLTVNSTVPTLEALWSFDEGTGSVAGDSSGSGHDGALLGPQWVADTPSGSGSALSFDGINDVVDVGEINVSGEALTIALWFKANSFAVSDARLISKANGVSSARHHWMLSTVRSGDEKLRFRLRTSGQTTTLIASSGVLVPGVWTHAAVVYDGAAMRIYKDGVEVGSTPKTGPLDPALGKNAAIGNQPPGAGSSPFDGTIDDVQIHSRAFTAAEIQALISSSPPDGTIDTPTETVEISVTESVAFTSTNSDPSNDFPLTYLWDFDEANSGVAPSFLEDPGPVAFFTPGVFTVTYTVTNASGLSDPVPPTVQVVVTEAGTIVDNTDAAFATTGGWSAGTSPPGYVGVDYLSSTTVDQGATASWNFNISQARRYGISAQWIDHSSNAKNAPYSIYNNGVLLDTIRVSQLIDGDDLNLLGIYDLVPGTLEVRLTDDASKVVIADAVSLTESAFGIVSPRNADFLTTQDVTVTADWEGYPATWGMEFVIDGNESGAVQLFAPPFEVVVSGSGDHQVDAYVIDDLQMRIAASSVDFAIGDYYVTFGDSITAGVGDDIGSDDKSADGRNDHKGFAAILNDQLTATLGTPHNIETEGVGGEQSVGGLARLPATLAQHPKAEALLILFGTNDAFWASRASGLGLDAGDPGYADSFKDYMHQMVEMVLASGKQAYLAKPPILLRDQAGPFADPPTAALNLLIQEYHGVVDELVVEFAIGVPPPDLYSHFETYPNELPDLVHPNGVGYQSLAALWHSAWTGIPINMPPTGTIDSPAAAVSVAAGQSVIFAGTGFDPEGDPSLSYLWDFDEANSGVAPSTLEDPGAVVFGTAGVFTVALTVTDSLGRADGSPATVSVTVTNDAPESVIDVPSGPLTVNVGEAVAFFGTGNDPDSQLPLSYLWDFDAAASGVAPSSLEDPSGIVFGTVGDFTISFTVTDGLGLSDPTPATASIVVTEAGAPESQIDTPASNVTIEIDTAASFSGTGTDREGDVPLSYLWDFEQAGSGVAPSSVEDPGAVTFSTLGSFTVTLTVTDSLGQPDPTPDTMTVTVIPPNEAPDSAIDAPSGSIAIAVGEAVNFSGSGSDVDATYPLTYAWDFDQVNSGIAPSSLEDPGVVVFDTVGTFSVSLTVTDAALFADPTPATMTVLVTPAPVLVDNEDAEFSTVGTWYSGTNPPEYIGGNYLAASPGTGLETATWSFTIAAAGEYGISAQWVTDSSNASDAPYTVYNNGAPLATVQVDQTRSGGAMQLLDVFDLVPGTMDVVLTDDGNGWVAADAVLLSQTAFGIASPLSGSLVTNQDVTATMTTLGLPLSWGVEFVVDGNDAGAIQSYSAPFGAVLAGLSLADHTLDTYAIDATGTRIEGISDSAEFTNGDYYVAFGDSIAAGYGDNIGPDNSSEDGRNDNKGFSAILNDLMTETLGYGHTVETEGLNLSLAADEVSRVAGALAAHPDAQTFLLLLGITDAFQEGTPSGAGLNPGDPGYAGSYKDSMEQIVAAVVADSREAVLSKLPMCVGDYSGTPFPDPATAPLNLLIQEYNQAIDELVFDFALSVSPPDLYSHFETYPGELFDDCHPSGVGYQSVAALWHSALTGIPINPPPSGTIDSPATAVSIAAGQSVNFTGTGSDPEGDLALTYLWDFDEANSGVAPSTLEDPGAVVFGTAGAFSITLTVTDSLGRADSSPATVSVTVTNDAPDSVIDVPTGPLTVNVGEPVAFFGTGSDPDAQLPLSYLWDFDAAASGVAPSSLEDPSVVFGTVGSFTVSFTVTDGLGLSDPTPATASIVVTEAGAPESQIDTPASNVTIEIDTAASFSGTGTDREGDLPLSYLWDFEQASSGVAPSSIEDPGAVVFSTLGTFTVTLTVTDSLGQSDPTPDSMAVTVIPPNQAPDGAIDAPAGSIAIAAGEAVNFSGSGSDVDATYPLTYAWDFDQLNSGVPPSTLEDPGAVVFDTVGTYTVTLTVTDAALFADPTPASVMVLVTPAPVLVDNEDVEFSSVGTWYSATNPPEYVGGDYLAASPGTGLETAAWAFTVTVAGKYGISSQWVTDSGNATDAPYTVYNNGAPIGTVRVDQTTSGGSMQLLGVFDLVPGTMDVVLTDDANGWVTADAVLLSQTAFGIASPLSGSLVTNQDVTVAMTTLGLPLSWGVEFVIDGDDAGAVQSYLAPFGVILAGLSLSDHTLDSYAIDGTGTRVEGISDGTEFTIGDYYVAFGDARVQGYGDNISSDNTSLDGRNDSKGFPPVLNDRLTSALGYAHTVENEGVPGIGFDSLDAVTGIDDILTQHPEAQAILILFGPNDALWSETPSGAGLVSGNPGYADSYKDNISRIVDAVQADGVEAVLGNVSLCFGDYSGTPFADPATAPLNLLIQEYNQAISEVVAEKGIAVTPPDFYGHFEAHPEEYGDDCYPNGVGYQSMSDLWRDALLP